MLHPFKEIVDVSCINSCLYLGLLWTSSEVCFCFVTPSVEGVRYGQFEGYNLLKLAVIFIATVFFNLFYIDGTSMRHWIALTFSNRSTTTVKRSWLLLACFTSKHQTNKLSQVHKEFTKPCVNSVHWKNHHWLWWIFHLHVCFNCAPFPLTLKSEASSAMQSSHKQNFKKVGNQNETNSDSSCICHSFVNWLESHF